MATVNNAEVHVTCPVIFGPPIMRVRASQRPDQGLGERRPELLWRSVAERAVGPRLIVVPSPGLDGVPGVGQIEEPVIDAEFCMC